MDLDKWNVLTALVKEAREIDRRTFEALNAATADWKAANAVLTDRTKVLDGYVTHATNEDTL